MILAELIAQETGVDAEKIMLLRHSNNIVKKLLGRGSSIEEYTFTQPTGSIYDYTDPKKNPIEVVVVIVNDEVYGVYRVLGVEREGTTYTLTSDAHRGFDIERGISDRDAKRFKMMQAPSISIGIPVSGWEGGRSRTPVQRSDGGFFWLVEVSVPVAPIIESYFTEDLNKRILGSLADDPRERQLRLAVAPKIPRRIEVISVTYMRSSDVIAEVLMRAAGMCERCGSPAPFKRRSDGSPYLEVHHKVRLADGGEDTVFNAIALCPNCHRREHYS